MSSSRLLALAAFLVIATVTFLVWPSKKESVSTESICVDETYLVDVVEEEVLPPEPAPPPIMETAQALEPISDASLLPPDVDRMTHLFTPYPPLLPFVETVTYAGRVDWLKGRSAFLGDYASHFKTSKHFISRSLHGMGNYLSDIVSNGDRFNVLRVDKEIEFHLVLDLARLKMWVYAYDVGEEARYLLKSYPVCAGRLNGRRPSGSLTPLGTFLLGNEIAVYKEGTMGTFKSKPRETITVFGVRWIPLGREIANCTGGCKGLGIHGAPWVRDKETGELTENRACIGAYASGGCIRLLTEDIEELFALIVSRKAYIHIVRDFSLAQLPGRENLEL